jgi:hypothetical protein
MHHKPPTYLGRMSEPLFPGLQDEARLSEDQRALIDEFRRMLERFSDSASRLRTSARLERFRGADQLLLELRELEGNLEIDVSAAEGEIVIAMGEGEDWNDHWHFAPTWNDVYGNVPDRRWTSLAVDFVAKLLRGEVRVSATYRDDRLLKVHSEVVGSDGEVVTSGTTGALSPRVLNFWAKRRVEERTVRFGR